MLSGSRQLFGERWERNAPAPETLSRKLFDEIAEGRFPRHVQNKRHNPVGCGPMRRRCEMGLIILIVVLVLIFGGGGGYYGYSRWGSGGGAGIGLGTILLILLICWLLGVFH